MCVVSMILTDALTWPHDRWADPAWKNHFGAIYRKAKEYDETTGQPDCESDDKRRRLQQLADDLGIEITMP